MTVKRTTFEKTFQGRKIPLNSKYFYYLSLEDNIWEDLEKSCMREEYENNYKWVEEGNVANLTIINILDPELIMEEYTRVVSVQTMGLDHHPQGLIDILSKHQYVEKTSKAE